MAKIKTGGDAERASDEDAQDRARRVALEAVAAKAKGKDDAKAETLKKAKALAEGYKPLILPYKDRDGKTVPCIVVGERFDNKRQINGDFYTDPVTKELVPEYQLIVYVFGGADQPHQAIYKFE